MVRDEEGTDHIRNWMRNRNRWIYWTLGDFT